MQVMMDCVTAYDGVFVGIAMASLSLWGLWIIFVTNKREGMRYRRYRSKDMERDTS